MRTAVALTVLMVGGIVAAPAGAHSTAPDPGDLGNGVEVTYTVRLDDASGDLLVRAAVDVPAHVDWVTLEPPPRARIVRTNDFEDEGDVYGTGGDAGSTAITYRIDGDHPGVRANASSSKPWAVFRRSVVQSDVEWSGSARDVDVIERVRPWSTTPRFAGDGIALVGEFDVVDSSKPGEHYFRVVVPEGVAMAADPDAVMSSLAFARRNFDAGHRHDSVTGFVFQGSDRSPGFAADGFPEFTVPGEAHPRGAGNPWLRGYVHTRQNFTLAPEMAWLYDGSAEYHAALLSMQHGSANWTAFREVTTVDRSARGADLREAARPVRAEKGAAVVAALDERIRRATDGERTFQTVLRRMNRRSEPVDAEAFARIVEGVTGEPVRADIDRMVTGEFDPAPPDDPALFAAGPGADHDGDGLSTAAEREAGTNPFATDADGVDDGTERSGDGDPSGAEATTPGGTPTEADGAAGGPAEVGQRSGVADAPAATATPAATEGGTTGVGLGALLALAAVLGGGARLVRRG